jgi:hypothetical protein
LRARFAVLGRGKRRNHAASQYDRYHPQHWPAPLVVWRLGIWILKSEIDLRRPVLFDFEFVMSDYTRRCPQNANPRPKRAGGREKFVSRSDDYLRDLAMVCVPQQIGVLFMQQQQVQPLAIIVLIQSQQA